MRIYDAKPILAPVYIYAMLMALLPASIAIDVFVAPSIYWPKVYVIPLLAAVYCAYFLFLALATGPFHSAPAWSRWARLATEVLLLKTLTTTCLPLLDQMLKIGERPLADWWLAKADAIIGFDWLAYFEFVHDRPAIITVLDTAYHYLGDLAFLLAVTLIFLGEFRRVAFHMETVVWTTLLSILISAVTPAYAAAIYYGIDFAEYPNFDVLPGIYHMEPLLQLREASPDFRVGEDPFKGLVTFPSIHTALGILMAGAVWRHWLFWPLAAYAAIMVPSTPVFGSHYVIDIIGGFVISVAVMWLVSKRGVYRELFASTKVRTDLAQFG